ncbi:hypothetical protein BS47DRAFT_1371133 [Hydnum rufescens UP504]|uniref:Uncharacterized protein n=1 Tax=Hydnum rufescens UP504 TaxID=1448309 RepID=A0A9P6DY20_9AGAM|nr:hypothetical protein BS47DRAFT_1371133 [Hydnum rufescens UP504]
MSPNLQPGEKRIIAQFHDESCFHANEFKSSACIMHMAKVIHDARKVIFPGASGDSWWDTQQLLVQVDTAMDIFDATHPDCQALFIFDQSSAHGNGGKQRKQKDTIIPCTNPTISMCGKPQKMTNENGEAKGLQAMLEERGFDMKGMRAKCTPICPFENDRCCMAHLLSRQDDFVNQISMLEAAIINRGHLCLFLPKFHCELNPIEMYWGYAKYHYCEVFKATFAEAKQTTIQSLDACPVETIRRFINRKILKVFLGSLSLKEPKSVEI